MEWVALSAGRCGSECVEYSIKIDIIIISLKFKLLNTKLSINTLFKYGDIIEIKKTIILKISNKITFFCLKDTLNKLGYKAKINTHTTSYIN